MSDLRIYARESDWDELKQLVLRFGERVAIRKNEYFVQCGDFSDKIAYVKRGAFKYARKRTDGKERILSFVFEEEFIASYIPFRNESQALMDVQAMEDSVLYILPINRFQRFFEKEIDGCRYVHKFTEAIAFGFLQKMLSWACDTPEERYFSLKERVPDIFNRVNLKDIASYIGVSPETLSRMRTSYLQMKS